MSLPSPRYRACARPLVARLRAHCDAVGINPPMRVLRRYATLRYIEAMWYERRALTDDRRALLDTLARRMRLDDPRASGVLLSVDLPDSLHPDHASACAAWPTDVALMIGHRDL